MMEYLSSAFASVDYAPSTNEATPPQQQLIVSNPESPPISKFAVED